MPPRPQGFTQFSQFIAREGTKRAQNIIYTRYMIVHKPAMPHTCTLLIILNHKIQYGLSKTCDTTRVILNITQKWINTFFDKHTHSLKNSHQVTNPPSKNSHQVTNPPSKNSHQVTNPPSKNSHLVTNPPSKNSHQVTNPPSKNSHQVTNPPEQNARKNFDKSIQRHFC